MSFPHRKIQFLLFVAVFTGVLFTGCRLGNRLEPAPAKDPLTGFYVSEPKDLGVCVTTDVERCRTVDKKKIPIELAEVMTNPMGLIVDNYDTGEGRLVGLGSGHPWLEVLINKDVSLETYIQGYLITPFDFPTCDIKLRVEGAGMLQFVSVVPPAGFTDELKGRIAYDASLTRTVQGDCSTALTLLKACYLNVADCGAPSSAGNIERFQWVTSLYEPYINMGSMDVEDITRATKLSYTASYQ